MYSKVILTFNMKEDSDNENADTDINDNTDSSVSLFNKEKLKSVKLER